MEQDTSRARLLRAVAATVEELDAFAKSTPEHARVVQPALSRLVNLAWALGSLTVPPDRVSTVKGAV